MVDRCCVLSALLLLTLQLNSLRAAAPPTHTGKDRYGDPLPRGVNGRLGTVRLRHGLAGPGELIFSPDGQTLLSCGGNGCRLWDATTGRALEWLPSTLQPRAARLLPDGKTLVTATMEQVSGRVERWQWGKAVLQGRVDLLEPAVSPYSCWLSHDGKLLVVQDNASKPILWDTVTGRRLHEIDRKLAPGFSLALSPDGRQLVLISDEGNVHIFNTASGKLVRTLAGGDAKTRANVSGMYFPQVSPDNRFVVLSRARELELWDLRTGQRLARREALYGPCGFSPDGKWLACAGRRTIHLLHARTLQVVRVFEPHYERLRAYRLLFSPDGNRLALNGESAVSLWDVAIGKRVAHPVGHLSHVYSVAFSPDGKRLASGGYDGSAYVWDLATSRPIHAFHDHRICVLGVAFSPDGRRLATGDGNTGDDTPGLQAQVRLFDLDAGQRLRQFHGHLKGVNALCFSPDGKRLATGGSDACIRLWDVASGQRLGQVRLLNNSQPVSFLAGGKSLLIHQWNGESGVMDATTLRMLSRFDGGKSPRLISMLASLPGERQAAAVIEPQVVWYDLAKGDMVRSINVPPLWTSARSALSPDARILARSLLRYVAEEIELWDLVAGKKFATLTGRRHFFAPLVFSPDSRLLASGSPDTTVLLWDVEQAWLDYMLGELFAGRGEVHHLAVFSAKGIAVLKGRLTRSAACQRRARKLIEDLDADTFAAREKAAWELEILGAEAAFILQQAVEAGPSAEVRARCQRVLNRLDKKDIQKTFNAAQLRIAVGLLVKLGTPQARRVLEDLAMLDRETVVGREARRGVEQMRPGKSTR